MCLTSQIKKLESDLSKQEQYIKYLYGVIEEHEGEIKDLCDKNSELRVKLKNALEDISFKEECLVSMEQKIEELENENIQLKNRILEYSSQLINPNTQMSRAQPYYANSDNTTLGNTINTYTTRLHTRLIAGINFNRITNITTDEANDYRNRILECNNLLLGRLDIGNDLAIQEIRSQRDNLQVEKNILEIERDEILFERDKLIDEINEAIDSTLRNILADHFQQIGEVTEITEPLETIKSCLSRLIVIEKQLNTVMEERDNSIKDLDECRDNRQVLYRQLREERERHLQTINKMNWRQERNVALLQEKFANLLLRRYKDAQHRRVIHNWLIRYNDDTEAWRQRNDRNSRQARDLY